MNEEFSFTSFLNERLEKRGMSLRKLSDLSGINLRHLENISRGEYDKLPPAPYLRGYMLKLGEILEFDHEEWWNHFKNQRAAASSGYADKLPRNRFARSAWTKPLAFTIAAIAIVAFLGFRFSKIIGKPDLTVDIKESSITVTSERFTVSGMLSNGDRLTINDESIPVNPDGSWAKEILLQPGLNTLEIKAEKVLGRETDIVRQIMYSASEASSTGTSTKKTETPKDEEKASSTIGEETSSTSAGSDI
jgi:cytoskeletal protein RodZ